MKRREFLDKAVSVRNKQVTQRSYIQLCEQLLVLLEILEDREDLRDMCTELMVCSVRARGI